MWSHWRAKALAAASWAVAAALYPRAALAHGDDDVTGASFVGPLVLMAVLAIGLALGRPLVRWLARRG